MMLTNFQSLPLFATELILIATILILFVADLLVSPKNRVMIVSAFAAIGAAFALAASFKGLAISPVGLFGGLINLDPFASFFKILILAATLLMIFISARDSETNRLNQGEYLALILALALGACVMASSTNLLMIYLSLEMVSLVSYVLAGYIKRDQRSSEASMKYVIYGGAASGVMIYGMSFLYGLTGSFDLQAVATALSHLDVTPSSTLTIFVASLLCLAGLGYKIACVPFHMWCPDVYEGSPTPVTAYFSVVPKLAGFAAMVRFFYSGLSMPAAAAGMFTPLHQVEWPMLLAAIACATMSLGNLVAIHQNSLKRLLAYSSIAHAGYMLMAFVVLTDRAVAAILFYLAVYFIMNIGAFFVVILIKEITGSDHIERFRGLGHRGGYASFLAIAMTVFLFSLTGLPPTAGFIGKVYLFAAVVHEKWVWLAIVGLLNSVVSLFYYAKIVKAMFLETLGEESRLYSNALFRWEPTSVALLSIFVIATIFFGLYWSPLADISIQSVSFIAGR